MVRRSALVRWLKRKILNSGFLKSRATPTGFWRIFQAKPPLPPSLSSAFQFFHGFFQAQSACSQAPCFPQVHACKSALPCAPLFLYAQTFSQEAPHTQQDVFHTVSRLSALPCNPSCAFQSLLQAQAAYLPALSASFPYSQAH